MNHTTPPNPATPDSPLSATVTLEQIDELLCLRVRHPAATALVALQGAQVLEYTPTGSRPVIWLSETAAFKRGQSPRGGIPVCWPWFGDLARNPAQVQATATASLPANLQAPLQADLQADLQTPIQTTILPNLQTSGGHGAATPAQVPAHGWVRNQPWLLDRIDQGPQHISLRLRYPAPIGLPVAWAEQIELTLDISIGARLGLALRCHNQSPATLSLSQALHSYFAISHVDQVEVLDLHNARCIDTLDNWAEKRDSVALTIHQETDRIYLDTPPLIRVRDRGWQRTLCIHSDDSASAVVWNPWIDKSRRLSQFPADAWQRMLCIETARVLDDCMSLPPGATGTMNVTIWQE
jgi:glucose-6-phosphate 1-epimerase